MRIHVFALLWAAGLSEFACAQDMAGFRTETILHVCVGKDGSASQVVVEKSCGQAVCDDAALAIGQRWRLAPRPGEKIGASPCRAVAVRLEIAEKQDTVLDDRAEYVAQVRGKIERHLVVGPEVPAEAHATVSILISAAGDVEEFILEAPSRSQIYNDAIRRAIAAAQPFPPLRRPVDGSGKTVVVLQFGAAREDL